MFLNIILRSVYGIIFQLKFFFPEQAFKLPQKSTQQVTVINLTSKVLRVYLL